MKDIRDERTLLVYEMNGEPLPYKHGFPLRIFIPNRYGMKQPKWIVGLEAIDREGAGYWVDRGWSKEAYVYTTSVVDNVTTSKSGGEKEITAGGIAWSGARGIRRVEVRIDNGPWTEAQLRKPGLSPLTWIQWRYGGLLQRGKHTIRVRAYDENGKLQSLKKRNPEVLDSDLGFHSISFEV